MATNRRTSTLVRRRSAIIRRDRQGLTWTELVQRIADDPCFDIHTADGKYWIDPFTGKRAAAAKKDRIAALHRLDLGHRQPPHRRGRGVGAAGRRIERVGGHKA